MRTIGHTGSGARPVGGGVSRARPSRGSYRWRALAVIVSLMMAGSAATTHVVVRGDSLWKLARRYGTTTQAIAEANNLPNPNLIIVGRHLTIPTEGAPVPQQGTTAWTGTHVVVAGENLTRIAAKYGTTPREIASANGIAKLNLIRTGQVLKVPQPSPPSVEELLVRYGAHFGVSPALVKAVAWMESGWKQEVVSSAGAIGVMQVLPETGKFAERHLLQHPVDLNDLEHNVIAGVRFLAYLLSLTGGDEQMALAGYFQGLRSVRTNGMSPATERYVANVMALKQRYGG